MSLETRLEEGGEWHLVARGREAALESLLALGNGYLGVRGAPDEGGDAHDPGVILNGFHETWPIAYPEDAHGLARTGQTIVSPPDGSVIRLFVDGEPAELDAGRRTLDMRAGVLRRKAELRTRAGARVIVRSARLASLEDRHLLAISYEVEVHDAPAALVVCSELATHPPGAASDDPRKSHSFGEKVLEPTGATASGTRALLELATRRSGLRLVCGMEHRVEVGGPVHQHVAAEGDAAALDMHVWLEPGQVLGVTKYVAYHWAPATADEDLVAAVHTTLDRAAGTGYAGVEFEHRRHVRDFWARGDVEIGGAPAVQKAVRFNLFQVMQATARAEVLGVAAKGVTGRGYEGHYFWDTEVYVLPYLAHAHPGWARNALEFRRDMLDAARRRAREVGHGGALFPWRTISGEEASAYYAAGTAQYHINASVVHAMEHYGRVTGDAAFADELLVETARFWMELGFFSERRDGQFCINAVTGPDEYSAVVDNNAYTNVMAKKNLEAAVRVGPSLGVGPAEVETWRRAAELMYIPRDEELGIVLQDDGFLDRKPWTGDMRQPLLLHYHPLEIYRHQVIKQTDVVLATYLAGDEFSAEEKRRTFDHYDPLTTGDSTLSACIQSVMAAEVGRDDLALDYFMSACAVDLLDLHGNTADGIHVASAGGTWLALVAGFAGLRDFDGEVRFAPRLPAAWEHLRFRLEMRGRIVEVELTKGATTYTLLEGDGLTVHHDSTPLALVPGEPIRRPAPPRPQVDVAAAALAA